MRWRPWLRNGALALCGLLLLAACSHDSSDEPQPNDDSGHLKISISIPVEEYIDSRAMGDPGTYEHFELPSYIYIYLVSTDHLGNQELIDIAEPLDGTWTKTRLGASLYPTEGDSIYTYDGEFVLDLPDDRSIGRVFVAVTSFPFANITQSNGSTLEERVMNTTVDLPARVAGGTDHGHDYLRNIYSTPYNLLNVDGNYYGTVRYYTTTRPVLNLILYHVAAKLDIVWNVASNDDQGDPLHQRLWLSDLELRNLKAKNCLLFRPMENTTLDGDTYNEGTSADAPFTGIINVGNQWYGRHAFYVIPYSLTSGSDNYYPVNIQVWKNGDTRQHSGNGYRPDEIRVPVTSGTNTVFTPWMRGFFNFNSVFDYN